ncbi:cupin domain-containing protein [Halopiger djelfimassiliensis]|uniref:cupin domain-containing protein n=1 Tax=Halopiger djelfimassiliensis TaxID=1293047 RepID=UPI000677F46B|nr:cupin domain-containing protein [Halopiger djelfimassiliensis]
MDHIATDDVSLAEVADGVYLGDVSTGDRASMKYWRVDPGATLPVHEHDNEQIGYVLRGTLTAIVGAETTEIVLEEGDAYRFPSGVRHGAENRSDEPAVGLGVLAPPRTDPDWREPR